MLLPAFSCNGIISEAINEVMNYGFNEMHLHSVEAIMLKLRFSKVLQKNGFIKKLLKRMNFMKDAFGQCNLFQIKQIITLYSFLSQLDYKYLRYYFIFASN
jgi:RimJ/RimL family protein N-acetyltransferase